MKLADFLKRHLHDTIEIGPQRVEIGAVALKTLPNAVLQSPVVIHRHSPNYTEIDVEGHIMVCWS